MDKTEMYNKIINAIDELDRVEGEAVIRNNVTFNWWEDIETYRTLIRTYEKQQKKLRRVFMNPWSLI